MVKSRLERKSEGRALDVSSDRSRASIAVLSQKIEPPFLASSVGESLETFLREYAAYEHKVELLGYQGVQATALPITQCMATGVLKYLCRYRMACGNWKEVTDEQVKTFLYGKKTRTRAIIPGGLRN